MGTIIVGYDGSATAEKAVREAARLAAALDTELHVVCAVPDQKSTRVEHEGQFFVVGGVDDAMAKIIAVVGKVARDITVTHSVASDAPVDALVREAEARDADMIVVGNKRTQGPSRLLGSVATGVVRRAPCSVHIAHTTG